MKDLSSAFVGVMFFLIINASRSFSLFFLLYVWSCCVRWVGLFFSCLESQSAKTTTIGSKYEESQDTIL